MIKVLFPTDFSPTSQGALELATSLARDLKATMMILFVEEPPAFTGGAYYGYADPLGTDYGKMLAQVRPSDDSVSFSQHMVHGVPANRIVEFAEENEVDYIVMGTHGRTAVTRLLMGSVAEEVVRRAPCPVVTFKPSAKAEKAEKEANAKPASASGDPDSSGPLPDGPLPNDPVEAN